MNEPIIPKNKDQKMYSIQKRFDGFPFAHRQHTHEGHCKLIHGHNWDFEICLEGTELDENGFVYDFGKFKWLKEWLTHMFDHTCVISEDDPRLYEFKDAHKTGLLNLRVVPSCSAEGLAKFIYTHIIATDLKVKLAWVKVYEDHKNSACYAGE